MSDLAARLTDASSAAMAALPSDEVAAIRRYQGLDRSYELVASVMRGLRPPGDLTATEAELVTMILRTLPVSIARWCIPEPLRVYRGQRSVGRFFGSGARKERVLVADSFLSTTIFREVALDEFTKPAGPGGPALLEISVPAGTPALWVPPIGDPALAYQGELLLDLGSRIAVRGERQEGGILVLDCEVMP
ncbi:MAG: ADP-ribosyltransferase [Pseudonocardiaceae bacterium]